MPHPPNGQTLQTWAPDTNYNPRLALVPSPLIRAGKKSIYANMINTITYLTAPLIIRKDQGAVLGTDTKWCCVHTLSVRYVTATY